MLDCDTKENIDTINLYQHECLVGALKILSDVHIKYNMDFDDVNKLENSILQVLCSHRGQSVSSGDRIG